MIFTSLGLLLTAGGFLLGGIAKSSVTLLIVSLALTVAAGVVLALAAASARGAVPALGGFGGHTAAAPAGQPMYMYVPVSTMPGAVAGTAVSTGIGNGGPGAEPLVGYDSMTAAQLTRLIDSGALSAEQLEAIAAYEARHAARKTVLGRLDDVRNPAAD